MAPSRIKIAGAELGVFASGTPNKGDVIGPYYGTIDYDDLSSRQPTRKVCGNGVLKVDVTQFSKYWLQLRVQSTRCDWIAERLGNGKEVCCFLALFCVCAFF